MSPSRKFKNEPMCDMEVADIFRGHAHSRKTDLDRAIMERKFVQDFLKTAKDGWSCGWHEANGGNLSYRLTSQEKAFIRHRCKPSKWKSLNPICKVPGLAGECLMITASGSHFRTLGSSPKECVGIIEIGPTGSTYRHIWGFNGGGRPTCELAGHLMIQDIKKRQSGGRVRVVYHAHPSNVIVFSAASSCAESLTRRLWGAMSEAAIVFPKGVGMLDRMVPGSIELAIATCREMIYLDAVVWKNHGLIACGDSFNGAFGLIETIDKACGICIKMQSLDVDSTGYISDKDLEQLSGAFSLGLTLPKDKDRAKTPKSKASKDASNPGSEDGQTKPGAATVSISIV